MKTTKIKKMVCWLLGCKFEPNGFGTPKVHGLVGSSVHSALYMQCERCGELSCVGWFEGQAYSRTPEYDDLRRLEATIRKCEAEVKDNNRLRDENEALRKRVMQLELQEEVVPTLRGEDAPPELLTNAEAEAHRESRTPTKTLKSVPKVTRYPWGLGVLLRLQYGIPGMKPGDVVRVYASPVHPDAAALGYTRRKYDFDWVQRIVSAYACQAWGAGSMITCIHRKATVKKDGTKHPPHVEILRVK